MGIILVFVLGACLISTAKCQLGKVVDDVGDVVKDIGGVVKVVGGVWKDVGEYLTTLYEHLNYDAKKFKINAEEGHSDVSKAYVTRGYDTVQGQFPYQAGLFKSGRHFCGASIISRNYVLLSAAHCLYQKPNNGLVTIAVGSISINSAVVQCIE